MRIEKIGQALGAVPASGFLAAYAIVYADSSEIIHGSLFGIQLFYRGRASHRRPVKNFDLSRRNTSKEFCCDIPCAKQLPPGILYASKVKVSRRSAHGVVR